MESKFGYLESKNNCLICQKEKKQMKKIWNGKIKTLNEKSIKNEGSGK